MMSHSQYRLEHVHAHVSSLQMGNRFRADKGSAIVHDRIYGFLIAFTHALTMFTTNSREHYCRLMIVNQIADSLLQQVI